MSEDAKRILEAATTQAELLRSIDKLKGQLSADEWKALGRHMLGRNYKSGNTARQDITEHFSNRILLKARVSSVKRIYGGQ